MGGFSAHDMQLGAVVQTLGRNFATMGEMIDSPPAPTPAAERLERLRARLAPLAAECLEITDESHLHAGHAGAAGGRGHVHLLIVAAAFDGLDRLARERLVHRLLGDLLTTELHAVRMNLYASDEL